MDDLTQNATPHYPRSDRPLFGLTVLVVEDSKFACEGIRLLCLRSGARIRRADCLRSARHHLQDLCTIQDSLTVVNFVFFRRSH